MKEADFVFL